MAVAATGDSQGRTSEREIAFGRLHQPVGVDSCPGVVLVHDVWGKSEHSRALGRRLANAGFAAVEIDLYRALANPGSKMRGSGSARCTTATCSPISMRRRRGSRTRRSAAVVGSV